MFLSAMACSVCKSAPMFLLISTSAISIDKISKAVPESKPLLKTVLEMLSGFSKTCVWCSLEPIVETIPSPTRAIIVSSPAPPTKREMFARTVIRAFAFTSIRSSQHPQ